MVKAKYRKWYLHWILHQDIRGNGHDDPDPSDDDEACDNDQVSKMPLGSYLASIKRSTKHGVRKLHYTWSTIEASHIHNCWIKSDIILKAWHQQEMAKHTYVILEMEYDALGQLIPKAHAESESRMNAMKTSMTSMGKMRGDH